MKPWDWQPLLSNLGNNPRVGHSPILFFFKEGGFVHRLRPVLSLDLFVPKIDSPNKSWGKKKLLNLSNPFFTSLNNLTRSSPDKYQPVFTTSRRPPRKQTFLFPSKPASGASTPSPNPKIQRSQSKRFFVDEKADKILLKQRPKKLVVLKCSRSLWRAILYSDLSSSPGTALCQVRRSS